MNFSRFIPAFIIAAITIVEMATDMYLPNLPAVLKEFKTTESVLHLTLSVNLFGLATAGLIAGPLSDALGRRHILLSGLILFLLGGIFCMLAQSVNMLIGARLMQGLGGGIVLVVGTAIMRDLFQGERLAKAMSMMGMMIAISPGLAPIIGGFIGLYLNWRATFGLLVISGVVLLGSAYYLLPETLATNMRQLKSSAAVFKDYIALFKCRPFILNGLILGLTIAQLWIEMGNLPFLFIQTLDVPSHHYGIYFGSGVFIFVLGTLFNQRYVMTLGINRLLLAGILLKILSVVLLCAAAFLKMNEAWFIQLLIYPGSFGLALIIGNASSQSLSAINKNVGAASAIIYLLEMALAGGALFIAGLFYNDTLWPIAIAGVIWIILVLWIYSRKHQ